jgi:hypothetical protein
MFHSMSWRIARIAALLAIAGLLGLPAARADISGFGDGSQFTINDAGAGNTASITSGTLQITAGSNDERHGVWFNNPQIATAFTASWTWQLAPDSSSDPADGFTFTIQTDPNGTSALGGGGGCLGYCGITPSVAVGFSVWEEHTRGTNQFLNGGYQGGGFRSVFLSVCPMDFASHNPINVNLTYDGTTLTEVLMDTVTGISVTFTYTLDLVGLGITNPDGTATVGFTGATGGANADQLISNFVYHEVH